MAEGRNFPFHKQFMFLPKLLTIGLSFNMKEEKVFFSYSISAQRLVLHIQCKFSSLLRLNGAFSARIDRRKYHQMDERISLLYCLLIAVTNFLTVRKFQNTRLARK
jgi:hypothetical protein